MNEIIANQPQESQPAPQPAPAPQQQVAPVAAPHAAPAGIKIENEYQPLTREQVSNEVRSQMQAEREMIARKESARSFAAEIGKRERLSKEVVAHLTDVAQKESEVSTKGAKELVDNAYKTIQSFLPKKEDYIEKNYEYMSSNRVTPNSTSVPKWNMDTLEDFQESIRENIALLEKNTEDPTNPESGRANERLEFMDKPGTKVDILLSLLKHSEEAYKAHKEPGDSSLIRNQG